MKSFLRVVNITLGTWLCIPENNTTVWGVAVTGHKFVQTVVPLAKLAQTNSNVKHSNSRIQAFN